MNTLSLPIDPAPLPSPGLVRRVRKYVKIMRVALSERLTYRLDFILSTLLRFLPMVTTILLWQAVFVGQTSIASFDEHEMIAYLLLVHIGRMFSSMPGLAAGIARDIRDGNLKKYLLQPIDMLAYLVAYRVGCTRLRTSPLPPCPTACSFSCAAAISIASPTCLRFWRTWFRSSWDLWSGSSSRPASG